MFVHVDWRFTAPVRPGDTITGVVEVLEMREDKPITKLATSVRRQDGVVALEGTAVCYTMDIGTPAARVTSTSCFGADPQPVAEGGGERLVRINSMSELRLGPLTRARCAPGQES